VEARLTLNEQAGGEEMVFVIVGDVNSRTRGMEPEEARTLSTSTDKKSYRTLLKVMSSRQPDPSPSPNPIP